MPGARYIRDGGNFTGKAHRCLAPKAAKRYNRLARETQSHRTHAEVMRFFDGLELLEPGLVPVQRWRPASAIEAQAHSAMWGGVGRKPPG